MLIGPIEAVRLFTRNSERAFTFYSETLELPVRLADEGLAIFETGQAKLVLELSPAGDPESDALVGRFAGISFTVTDIAKSMAALESKGVVFDGPPQRQDWGGLLAHFQDPDGNVLTLVQYPT